MWGALDNKGPLDISADWLKNHTGVQIVFIFLRITLAHQTQKVTRVAAPYRNILVCDPESIASGKKENEDDGNPESNQKREKFIAAWIGRPLKLSSRN